ncbi:MAG: SDR family oxidoreductase [Rhodobacteraceae bacterium]|nr:SDR family oxidoreductase [Paracoccaceae bacterium]
MMQLPGLAGRRVAVTGAATGIGYDIAKTLLDAGCRVAVCDVDAAAVEEASANLGNALVSVADVADEEEVSRFFGEVSEEFGGLDALVNNAGIAGPTSAVEFVSAEEWQRCVDVGLTGQFLCVRSCVELLRDAGGGAIVNMSSVVGKLGLALRAPYSAVKFGVIGLTQCLAKELGPSNIRVNAILPGVVRGRRIQQVIDARAEAIGVSSQEMEKTFLSAVSMRRMVEASDISAMSAFLISDLGRHVSGQSIAVDANVETI